MNANSEPQWLRIFRSGETVRVVFRCLLVPYGAGVYLLMTVSVAMGWPLRASVAELLTSFILVFLTGWLWEDGGRWLVDGQSLPKRRLDPRAQSWAFLADLIGLAPMLAFAALASRQLSHFVLYYGPIWVRVVWVVGPVALGLGASWSFRRGEADSYPALSYFSFTKLLHNGVAFTMLSATIIYVLPLLIYGLATGRAVWWCSLGLLGMAIWGAGAVADGKRANLPAGHPLRLDGRNLHVPVDKWGRRLPSAVVAELGDMPSWGAYLGENPDQPVLWSSIFHTRKLAEAVRYAFGRKRSDACWSPPVTAPPRDDSDGEPQEWGDDPPHRPG